MHCEVQVPAECLAETGKPQSILQRFCALLSSDVCHAVDEEDAADNNMEAEASGSDREEAEQDDIEQHAPGGRRAGGSASAAAANGHKREGEDNADADVAVCVLLCSALPSQRTRYCSSPSQQELAGRDTCKV